MRHIQTFILEHIGELIFAGISALLGVMFRELRQTVKEQKALRGGVIAMLHDRIYAECEKWLTRGGITTDALHNLEHLYKSYHELGGNGTGTNLYERAKALPIIKDE